MFFLTLTAALLLVIIFAERLCPYDPNLQDTGISLQPPSLAHPAGTDRFGRDMFSRILVGLKTSITSALTLVAIITVTGTAAGVLCGFYGGILDSAVMRISDVSGFSGSGICDGNRRIVKRRHQKRGYCAGSD